MDKNKLSLSEHGWINLLHRPRAKMSFSAPPFFPLSMHCRQFFYAGILPSVIWLNINLEIWNIYKQNLNNECFETGFWQGYIFKTRPHLKALIMLVDVVLQWCIIPKPVHKQESHSHARKWHSEVHACKTGGARGLVKYGGWKILTLVWLGLKPGVLGPLEFWGSKTVVPFVQLVIQPWPCVTASVLNYS